MFPHLTGFNLRQWIDDNRGNWGQRRVIWENSDFIAFVTRGPNRRKDFHVNPGDEIFYNSKANSISITWTRKGNNSSLYSSLGRFFCYREMSSIPRVATMAPGPS